MATTKSVASKPVHSKRIREHCIRSPSRFPATAVVPPTVKTMKVEIDHQFTTFTWNISGGNNVQNNDYATETWKFTGGKEPAIITLMSEDPKKSTYGPVVAGMAITKD